MKIRRWRKRGVILAILVGVLLLGGCSTLRFYTQGIHGGLEVLLKRRSIEKLLTDHKTPEALKERLRVVQEVRAFATEELALPDNGSYRHYSDLGRPFAVWNVVAAPELAVEPLTWCFPFAGCVSYRGYFSQEGAERFARRLDEDGYDTSIGGVTTYSTLGWFQDPVLNTFIQLPDEQLAGVIFHELAHQRLYLPGDTTFNESFASVVETEGVRRWLQSREGATAAEKLAAYRLAQQRGDQFAQLILKTREKLAELYQGEGTEEEKLQRKAELFDHLQEDYRQLKGEEWGGYDGYDRWFARPLNNAHLASVGAYNELVPGIEAILAEVDGDLAAFYRQVEELAQRQPEERLERLAPSGGLTLPATANRKSPPSPRRR